jgi:hypothetical protein
MRASTWPLEAPAPPAPDECNPAGRQTWSVAGPTGGWRHLPVRLQRNLFQGPARRLVPLEHRSRQRRLPHLCYRPTCRHRDISLGGAGRGAASRNPCSTQLPLCSASSTSLFTPLITMLLDIALWGVPMSCTYFVEEPRLDDATGQRLLRGRGGRTCTEPEDEATTVRVRIRHHRSFWPDRTLAEDSDTSTGQ